MSTLGEDQHTRTPREAPEASPATDYGSFVTSVVRRMTQASGRIDQRMLRRCIGLASSYLITDMTMNPVDGFLSWQEGLSRLVDVIVALNARGELELETVSEASKACSECWSVAGTWRDMENGKECVRGIAGRLKRILDENGSTYRGQRIYVP